MKILDSKNKVIAKWVIYLLNVIAPIIVLLGNHFVIEGHILLNSMLFLILSNLFLIPLIRSITISEDGKVRLEFRRVFLIRGFFSLLLILSSYMVFLYNDNRIDLWFWTGMASLVLLLVMDIIIIFIKVERDHLEKSFWKKFNKLPNRIVFHFHTIFMLILVFINIYDYPRELYLENIKSPTELVALKFNRNGGGYRSIEGRVDIIDREIVQVIYDEISSNKEVSNIRGPEYISLLRAESNSDYYFLISPRYDEEIQDNKVEKRVDSITIQSTGYVTVNEDKPSFNIFKLSRWEYKIQLSPQNIKKIEEAFSNNKQGL